jgi:hypothetical protein
MESRKVDLLNIGLILLSLLAAFWMPFGVFLFSYAVLGPLHYITEINWLDERAYFSKSPATPWLLGAFVFLICLGSYYSEGAQNPSLAGFRAAMQQSFAGGFFRLLSASVVHLLFLSFVLGVSMGAFKDWKLRALIFGLGITVAFAFDRSQSYIILVGSMLPTIFHVSLFTGVFMLFGAMKSESRPGYAAVVAFILAHLVIVFWPIDAGQYALESGSKVSESFTRSGFSQVESHLAVMLGSINPGANFDLYNTLGVRLAIFLAFAYTYHYLNWFSKTSIIRWHQVSKRKLVWAAVIWIASIALYLYDYRVGLLALLFLSLLHVVFEFPLNYLSISGVFTGLGKKLKLTGRS